MKNVSDLMHDLSEIGNNKLRSFIDLSEMDDLADYIYCRLVESGYCMPLSRLVVIERKENDSFVIGFRGTFNYIVVKKYVTDNPNITFIPYTFNVRADEPFMKYILPILQEVNFIYDPKLNI